MGRRGRRTNNLDSIQNKTNRDNAISSITNHFGANDDGTLETKMIGSAAYHAKNQLEYNHAVYHCVSSKKREFKNDWSLDLKKIHCSQEVKDDCDGQADDAYGSMSSLNPVDVYRWYGDNRNEFGIVRVVQDKKESDVAYYQRLLTGPASPQPRSDVVMIQDFRDRDPYEIGHGPNDVRPSIVSYVWRRGQRGTSNRRLKRHFEFDAGIFGGANKVDLGKHDGSYTFCKDGFMHQYLNYGTIEWKYDANIAMKQWCDHYTNVPSDKGVIDALLLRLREWSLFGKCGYVN